ncbi:MAG: hypothetical protein KBG73_08605 [Candidatus Promineofilum sp.]|nr:hypothetical protein [Promineifilum sp.]
MSDQPTALNPLLLELLRCPVAVRAADHGPDPGRLRLVRDCWLVCDESGMKYPIRDGIAIMLVDEGEKWRATDEADLPVPPPAA